MSFLSALGGIFKKIGHGVDVVTDVIQPFAPIIGSLPVIGGPFGLIFGLVAQVENLVSTDSSGAEKKAAVIAMVRLKYPKLDPVLVSTEIDNLVGILNRLAKAVEPIPPA